MVKCGQMRTGEGVCKNRLFCADVFYGWPLSLLLGDVDPRGKKTWPRGSWPRPREVSTASRPTSSSSSSFIFKNVHFFHA